MAHLTRTDIEAKETMNLQPDGSIIGRLPSSDVLIMEREVSRRHARVWLESGVWQIEDLGSRCGVRVNGQTVRRMNLGDGDRIDIGSVRLTFSAESRKRMPRIGSPNILSEQSLMQSVLLESIVSESPARSGLEAVVRAGERLRSCHDAQGVMDAVLLTAQECTSADRGVLQQLDAEGEVQASASIGGSVHPSRTFLSRVLEAQVALIAEDVDLDVDLASAESIMASGVKSMVCAPMWDGERVAGVIYLERKAGAFRNEDSDLLVALGYQAASELLRLEAMSRLQHEQGRRKALARFLPKGIADNMIDSVGGLDVQEAEVAIVAAELTGVEAWDSTVGDLLDAFVEVAVDGCGGTLVSVSPSGLRVVFGAPASAGAMEDIQAAASAAVKLVAEGEKLRRQKSGWSTLRLKVGVHFGKATVGMLGPERRKEYCAVGEAMDGADAVLRASMAGRALVSMAVWPAVAGTMMGVPRPGAVHAGQPAFWLRG